jgi:hypothetical protein
MTSPKTALLLIGSAKPAGKSTSEALGDYLAQRLHEHGIATTTMHVAHALRTEVRTAALLAAVDATDIVILAYPLYVDGLPYLVTQALERIAAHAMGAHRAGQTPARRPLFLAIANCGFPEAQHNAVSLAICEQFAAAAGFAWAGGLASGQGGAIAGRPLAGAGGMTHNVVTALDLVAVALAEGKPAPEDAVALMARPFIPARAYTLMGNFGWLMQARQHRALTRLAAQPFAGR